VVSPPYVSLKAHPVLVVEFLKEYYTHATNIIHKYNGVLDKFIGDGIMAFFGFHNLLRLVVRALHCSE
jgi:class 3 adenylate cyclase